MRVYEPPKCKLSLNFKNASSSVAMYNPANFSSRSSSLSIRSLDSEKSRSFEANRLYRTRSHSSFANAYIKDPEPMHYHVPKCNSCGALNNCYVWDLPKVNQRYKQYGATFCSIDNIQTLTDDNFETVKVKTDVIPLLKLKVDDEFVESQEFNEDNYFEDIGNSFSDNQTVIETVNSDAKNEDVLKSNTDENVSDNVYRAECVKLNTEEDFNNNTLESIEGEYHSFTDEMDFEEVVYESPVKDLVEKDIRDYSVPINFYCDDYARRDSPRASPLKKKDTSKQIVLEPILEESKSYEESSYESNKNTDEKKASKEDSDKFNDFKRPADVPIKDETDISLNNNRQSSEMYVSSEKAIVSFDSTAEFEKYEVISEILAVIIDSIDYEAIYDTNSLKQNVAHNETLNVKENDVTIFSITDIVRNIECNTVNITPVEISNSFMNNSSKIAESLIYYIFNKAVSISLSKIKYKKFPKSVITIVDVEDILFTTNHGWISLFDEATFHILDKENVNVSDAFEHNSLTLLLNNFMSTGRGNVEAHFDIDVTHPPLYLDNIGSNTSESNEDMATFESDGHEMSSNTKESDSLHGTFVKENVEDDIGLKDQNGPENPSNDVACDIICALLEKSLLESSFGLEKSANVNVSLNETFVLQDKEVMNEAFMESEYSRSSTPRIDDVFDVCNESPIKHNLTHLYEKDDSILGSPFVKKTQVLSMSQTAHRGGIKYWLSFADDMALEPENSRRLKKFDDNTVPSYFVVDFNDGKTLKRTSRRSVLLEDTDLNINEMSNDTFSKYDSCEDEPKADDDKEKLLYDTRCCSRRLATSWPPVQNALFYRIVNNFRTTDSFDMSDLTYSRFENSL